MNIIAFYKCSVIFIIILLRLLVRGCFGEKRERERKLFYLTRL